MPTIAKVTTGVSNLGTGMRVTCTLAAEKTNSIVLLDKGVGYAGGTLPVDVTGGGGGGATITAVFTKKQGNTKTSENTIAFDNGKRYRYNLNNLYSNTLLGFNAEVAIDLVAVPR